MRKFFTFFFLVVICLTTWSQTHVAKTLSYGGTVRQYLEYVPDSYDNTHPAPVLFCLHGLGDTMTNFAQSSGFTEIAEEHGWIMITPQALPANISVLGMDIPMGAAWGAGVKATTLLSTIELNPNVDDVGFLMAILDYGLDGTEPELSGAAAAMWMLTKPNLDASIKKADAGAKGSRPGGTEGSGRSCLGRHRFGPGQHDYQFCRL